ncbi:MAG: hypothetical protein MUF22_09360, partial [Chitinispirillaceae bacterium]|nr:hypothetical protein [Chitinispirillaceae bacterium]
RHYHGPLYFYWLAAARTIGVDGEAGMRYTTLLILLFCSLAHSYFIFMLFPQEQRIWTALPMGLLIILGPSLVLTVNHITPHSLYLFLSVFCLGSLALFAQRRATRYWYGAVVFAGLAFITLEYALFLVVTLLATLFLFKKGVVSEWMRLHPWKFGVASLGCFLLPMVLLWPSGLFKLTIVKNYIFYAYFTIIRGSLYSSFTPLEVWSMRVRESPIEYALIIATILLAPFIIKRFRFLLPCAVYAFFILLTTVRNTSTLPQYIASAFPALYFLGAGLVAWILTGRSSFVRSALVAGFTAIVLVNFYFFFTVMAGRSAQPTSYQVARLDDIKIALNGGAQQTVFLSRRYVPTLHYYFPDVQFTSYKPGVDSLDSVLVRIAGLLSHKGSSAWLIVDNHSEHLNARIDSLFVIHEARDVRISSNVRVSRAYRLANKGEFADR